MFEKNASDGKQTLKRFNVFDAVVIILIAIAIAVPALLTFPNMRNVEVSETEITYTVLFEKLEMNSYDLIKEAQTAYEVSSGRELGVVDVAPEISPYYEYILSEDGLTVTKNYTDKKYNVLVTIRANATYKKGEGYSINGCKLAIDEVYELRFSTFNGSGKCKSIDEVK